MHLFEELARISCKPEVFSAYTAHELWTTPHISERMLLAHLDPESDRASRSADFVTESIGWITERFGIGDGSTVLDLGCGPGLYSNRLAETGASVVGVDLSPRSIEYATRTGGSGANISYVCCDYLDYEIGEAFDLVMMVFCDYSALSSSQRSAVLAKVHESLAPGGSFLFDVCSLAAFSSFVPSAEYGSNLMSGFWSPDDYFGFRHSFVYGREKVVVDKYDIVSDGAVTTYYNWLKHFDRSSLSAELQAAGLRVSEIHRGVAGGSYDEKAAEFAVIAQRQ